MLYYLVILVLIFVSFIANSTFTSFFWLFDAKVLLPLTVFYVSAVTVNFPIMLIFAFLTGFFWDIVNVHLVDLQVLTGIGEILSENEDLIKNSRELSFGYSILIFGLFGSVMQGIKPKYYNRQWLLPILFVGFAVFFHLLIEYLLINLLKGDFYFPLNILYKMLISAGFSLLLSPLIFLILVYFAKKTRHSSSYNYIRRRRVL